MPRNGSDAAFDRLADHIFEALIECDPVEATRLGIHGENDARLPDRSAEGCRKKITICQELLRELADFRERDLSVERLVDLRLAKGKLNARVYMMQKHPRWKCCPYCYVEDVTFGLHTLLCRDFAPVRTRARRLLGRLRAVPGHLDRARENLVNPAAISTEGADLMVRGALEFFTTTMKDFTAEVDDPELAASLRKASAKAQSAVSAFSEWLEGNLLPRSGGEFAIGRAAFERLVSEEHHLSWGSEELITIGQRVYLEAVREMKRVAARLDPNRPWSKVVETLKEDHLDEEEILPAYKSEVLRARAFVQEHQLVTVPDGESLEVVATPEFARPLTPYSTYVPPAPFEEEQKGTVWVTTIDPGVDEVHRQSLLKGHARNKVTVRALNKSYPGSHVQSLHSNMVNGRKLRWLFPSNLFSHGWALYCEGMMHEQGFYGDDRTRLFQLKQLLWRACRVIIDVGLQTGRMGFNDAVDFLVRKAHIERQHAVADVRRYCTHPSQPMCCVLGRVMITELLEDYRAVQGDRFDLRSFHDDLLSHGAIPIELVRMEMGIPHRAHAGRSHRRRGTNVHSG